MGEKRPFAYDASGQRVKTVEPGGKTTYFPFANYEETVVGGSTIKRSSYALAGQVVAFRVAGDPVPTNNGLFFIYGDHLGSTTMLGTSGGAFVAGSLARYRPYGSYRTAPTQTLTDRDFTGQRENREIGLLYYNARFYMPSIGRFVSADTLVPSPANPQSFNRYSYVRNSPLNRVDPTGHLDNCAALGDINDIQGCNTPPPPAAPKKPRPSIPTGNMVNFSVADGCGCSWSEAEMATIQESATITGTRLAETFNTLHPHWNLSASEAFLLVYGSAVEFQKMGVPCASGCWGETFLRDGIHVIEVYNDIVDSSGNNNLEGDAHWAVHELGHAFVNAVSGRGARPVGTLLLYQWAGFPNRPRGSDRDGTFGFAGGRWEWQRSSSGSASEEFADMYLGWAYNQWELDAFGVGLSQDGQMRASFMNNLMPIWLNMGY